MKTLHEIAKKIAALPEEEREEIMRKVDKWAQEYIDNINWYDCPIHGTGSGKVCPRC